MPAHNGRDHDKLVLGHEIVYAALDDHAVAVGFDLESQGARPGRKDNAHEEKQMTQGPSSHVRGRHGERRTGRLGEEREWALLRMAFAGVPRRPTKPTTHFLPFQETASGEGFSAPLGLAPPTSALPCEGQISSIPYLRIIE
ncbi:hypothetical protein LOZ23_005797 [Ophidiomyces ophidiicola]|nr:hypothetical protein LOZ23_005797 [Ophidiomyces ophidiicola]